MKNSNKSGFSIIKIVIIIAVTLLIGGSSYYAYITYIAPELSPYSKLVPDELKDYAVGSNADAFMIIKNDTETIKLINKIPTLTNYNQIKSTLFLYNSKNKSAVLIIATSSADIANTVKTSLESMVNSPIISNVKIEITTKDKIVIANIGEGLSSFTGKITDNPNLKTLDKQLLDSQVIVYLNNTQIPETSYLLFPLVNIIFSSGINNYATSQLPNNQLTTAHAQADFGQIQPGKIANATRGEESLSHKLLTIVNYLIPLSKETTFYLKIKDSTVQSKILVNLMNKDEFFQSPVFKTIIATKEEETSETMKKITDEYKITLEKTSEEYISQLNTIKPELQKQVDTALKNLPGASLKFDITDKLLMAEGSIPQPFIEAGLAKLELSDEKRAMSARDTERKVRANDIVVAIEQYNATNNKYPQQSACVDQISEIQDLFKAKKSPVDKSGSQDFKVAICQSGFYYQYFKNNQLEGYAVWAKMEAEDGNTNSTPEDYLNAQKSGSAYPKQITNGKYYLVDQLPSSEVKYSNNTSLNEAPPTTENTPPPVHHVKRSN